MYMRFSMCMYNIRMECVQLKIRPLFNYRKTHLHIQQAHDNVV